MVADTNTPAEAAGEAAKAQADAVAETTKSSASAGERTAKTARKSSVKAARKTTKAARKAAKPRRKAKAATAKAQPSRIERTNEMNFDPTNLFAGFSAFPGTNAFEKLFADAAERSEEAVKRSRKAAEELADMYRDNIDAVVEAGRIAATGAQSIGQEVAAKSRDGIELAANNVRALAEAKSPTELLQLQGEFARTAFDRFVEDSSALTEAFVKLAGEAFQPISNRASANVERLNKIAA